MKSSVEILAYYEGHRIGLRATSQLDFGSWQGAIVDEDKTRVIDSALLYDADRLAKASLESYLACSHSRAGGYDTWGEISLYYSRFFIISAMLRLVGIAPIGGWLLLRTEKKRHEYERIRKKSDKAKSIGCGGGSHTEIWGMFAKYFGDWEEEEAPSETVSLLKEDPTVPGSSSWYRAPIDERNSANYLRSDAGLFFPETDFSGLEGYFVEDAKTLGDWNWLRTDASPEGLDDPPEAWFFDEMMTWNLIKFVISVLVRSQGDQLLQNYLWLFDNLSAHPELREQMKTELLASCSDK